jgi:hypothetical protein
VKTPADSRTEAGHPSDAILAAYHDAGHTIAGRAIGNGSLDDWLTLTAAGQAAERELVRRLGLRWRGVTSHAGHDLDSCYRRIREEMGEDPGDWILLHWIRAVRRATRLLTGRWSEVQSLAELNGRREAGRGSASVGHALPAGKPRSSKARSTGARQSSAVTVIGAGRT